MSFLQRFLRAWREARLTQAYDFVSDGQGGLTSQGAEWTKEDYERTLQYFSGISGVKMLARLYNNRLLCAAEAARHVNDRNFHCGIAQGAAINLKLIEEHFANPPRSEDKIETDASSSVVSRLGVT